MTTKSLHDLQRHDAAPLNGATQSPYSRRILERLAQAHGWVLDSSARASATKVFTSSVGNRTREFHAVFDADRERYIAFEAGWLTPFDIDARDRNIYGVAAEFDLRATSWVTRELDMPALPQYVRRVLGASRDSLGPLTHKEFARSLDQAAAAAGVLLDDETRLNAHHCVQARSDFGGPEYRLPSRLAAVTRLRPGESIAEEVTFCGRAYQAEDLITELRAGRRVGSTDADAVEILCGFGMGRGRAFDVTYTRDYAKAVASLEEILDLDPLCH